MDWIDYSIMLIGFSIVGMGFYFLGMAIRDLQRQIETITQLPPERVKYVMIYEKECDPLGLEER